MAPLSIPDDLRERLRQLRTEQLQWPPHNQWPELDEFFSQHEVVVITTGLGPAVYLGLDGRVIFWNYEFDEAPRETTDMQEIKTALTIAARRWSMPELRSLLPEMK